MMILGRRCFPLCYSLLFCLLLSCVSTLDVIATVGTDATLSCSYDAQYYGRLSVCWGRGAIPNSGCADEVIKSDGTSVTSRLSERYQLIGDLGSGDVSLTITQVEESDSGMYGCRVEIPGWFNDQKQQLTLTVVAVRPNPLKVEPREVKERTVTVRWTPGFDGGRPITSYRVDLKNKQASWDTAVRTEVSNPALTQVTVVDLRPAKTYNLCMFAVNSVGMSEPSNVLTVTTKEAAPEGPPLDMHLEALSPHSIKVTWKPPRADLRNGVLRSYSISYREYDPTDRQYKKWQHQSVTATREVESVILNNLKPSAKYGVLVQAKTNAGIGPAATAPFCSTLDEVHITSTASLIESNTPGATVWIQDTSSFTSVHTTLTVEPVTAATDWGQSTSMISVPPDPPVVKLKEVIDNTISLCWAPGFEGDSPITGYYLEYKAMNASWDYIKTVVDFSSNETEATIIEINPSTYNIRMFAKNSLGTSRASNVLTITTGETGHQRDYLVTATPIDIHDTARVEVDEARHDIHLAAIVVPVVLVVLIVATAITWYLQRIKRKQGNLNMWGNNRAVHYRGSELLQEL
ncbi:Down syndrome cell adhesion molecule homolog [Mastacembelus armatus]|uniref:Down syndrome cell adhesion molecule homolog n=1 Tax=Mastacembelus armatus TaxID=205130 RepID=UPI000E45E6E1|nr:Down syndrome cell adhesion molecule homolog [Mastacembelus armatus]